MPIWNRSKLDELSSDSASQLSAEAGRISGGPAIGVAILIYALLNATLWLPGNAVSSSVRCVAGLYNFAPLYFLVWRLKWRGVGYISGLTMGFVGGIMLYLIL